MLFNAVTSSRPVHLPHRLPTPLPRPVNHDILLSRRLRHSPRHLAHHLRRILPLVPGPRRRTSSRVTRRLRKWTRLCFRGVACRCALELLPGGRRGWCAGSGRRGVAGGAREALLGFAQAGVEFRLLAFQGGEGGFFAFDFGGEVGDAAGEAEEVGELGCEGLGDGAGCVSLWCVGGVGEARCEAYDSGRALLEPRVGEFDEFAIVLCQELDLFR